MNTIIRKERLEFVGLGVPRNACLNTPSTPTEEKKWDEKHRRKRQEKLHCANWQGDLKDRHFQKAPVTVTHDRESVKICERFSRQFGTDGWVSGVGNTKTWIICLLWLKDLKSSPLLPTTRHSQRLITRVDGRSITQTTWIGVWYTKTIQHSISGKSKARWRDPASTFVPRKVSSNHVVYNQCRRAVKSDNQNLGFRWSNILIASAKNFGYLGEIGAKCPSTIFCATWRIFEPENGGLRQHISNKIIPSDHTSVFLLYGRLATTSGEKYSGVP